MVDGEDSDMVSSKSAKDTVCGNLAFGGAGGASSSGREDKGPIRLPLSCSCSESELELWSPVREEGDEGEWGENENEFEWPCPYAMRDSSTCGVCGWSSKVVEGRLD